MSKLLISITGNYIMEYPIIIYDNYCSSCTSYANLVNKLMRGKITMYGHFTKEAKEIKKIIFPPDYEGLEMSWFVTENTAYGGREGLKQLTKYWFTSFNKSDKNYPKNIFDFNQCSNDCKSVKGIIIRSCSILSTSKIFKKNC